MQLPDSHFFDSAWNQARKNSSLLRWEKDPASWQVFWELFAPTYLKIARALWPGIRELVHGWCEEGLLDQGSLVLDIGCGPGTYTLPLGEQAGKVVAMDTSANMLRMLNEEAQRQGLQNIRPYHANWNHINPQGEYDLVFAANSPAIHNRKTLLKISEASRRCCMLICYAGKETPALRHHLWQAVMGEKLQGNTSDISYPFNILYREGFFPNLRFHRQEYSYTENVDRVLENYRVYFQIFGKKGLSVERILEDCVKEYSVNGLVQETVAYKQAVMWWPVKM